MVSSNGVAVTRAADCGRVGVTLEDRGLVRKLKPALSRKCPNNPREALEFVAHKKPLCTCRQCAREFAGRGPVQVKLRQWFVAVASMCRRCGSRLTPTRTYTARAIHEIVVAHEPYARHTFVCERLARAFDDERPISAVIRAKRALAAPLPIDPQVFYRAQAWLPALVKRPRFCGNLSARDSFADTRTATATGDRPPTDRIWHDPWSAKSLRRLVCPSSNRQGWRWDQLKSLGLVEYGDQLLVKDILAAD